jgi:RNA-directed DNA polymerase
MNPTGGGDKRRVDGKPDPDENLLERILSRANMLNAWERVKANKGAPGIDNMPVEGFMDSIRERWDEIRASLYAGSYQPLPVKRVEIPKATGGTRPLGIPTVLDRMIQQAIAQVLLPIFDPLFSVSSFGFRPGRSAKDAVYQVRDYIRKGYRVAVDADLSKFFDTVEHDVLMYRVARRVRDKRVLQLIGKYLRAGVVVDGRRQETRKGVPQGGPLSPLLSNILLDDLDKELERRGHKFSRYADDFVILVKSLRAGERVMANVTRFLEQKLKLKVNQDKSKVASTNGITFLGFSFKGAGIRWSDKAFAEFKRLSLIHI